MHIDLHILAEFSASVPHRHVEGCIVRNFGAYSEETACRKCLHPGFRGLL